MRSCINQSARSQTSGGGWMSRFPPSSKRAFPWRSYSWHAAYTELQTSARALNANTCITDTSGVTKPLQCRIVIHQHAAGRSQGRVSAALGKTFCRRAPADLETLKNP